MKKVSIFSHIIVLIILLSLSCTVFIACDGNNTDDDYADAYSSDITIENGEVIATYEGDVTVNFGKLSDLLYKFEELEDGSYAAYVDATMVAEGLTKEQDGLIYELSNESMRELVTELDFPSAYQGKAVTAIIGEYNPYGALTNPTLFTCVTSIKIPETVTVIGDNAFYGHSSLTSITLHEGIVELGSLAFSGCEKLTSVTLPSSLKSLGDGAFGDCSSLYELTIPDTVEYIGSGVVSGCNVLSHLKMPLPDPDTILNGVSGWFASFAGGVEGPLTLEITKGDTLYSTMLNDHSGLTKLIIHQMNVLESGSISSPNLVEIELGEGVARLEDNVISSPPTLKKLTVHGTPSLKAGSIRGKGIGEWANDFTIHFDGTKEELIMWLEGEYLHAWFGHTVVCSNGTITLNWD